MMRSATELVLVRHGETEWTERGLVHGRLDSPLSVTGRRQAELTAEKLRGERFDALYSSPVGRAMQTAEILGMAVGLTPIPLEDLQEINFGWLEGKKLPDFLPNGKGPLVLRPLVAVMMGLSGEQDRALISRIARVVDRLARKHPCGRLLVVTHWGILAQMMVTVARQGTGSWRDNGPWTACGITTLVAVDGKWKAVQVNDATHLGRAVTLEEQ